jgi:hypothetical protein
MAGRSSIGLGAGIAIFVSSLLAIAFLVLAAVFFTKFTQTRQELQTARADLTEFVTSAERNRDEVRIIADTAKKARKSAISYLVDQYGAAMARVTGVRTNTVEDMEKALASYKGTEGSKPLTSVLAERDSTIKSLENAVKQAEEARTTANANLTNEIDRVKKLETNHKATVDALTAEVGQYKTEVDAFRKGTDELGVNIRNQLEKCKNEAADSKKGFEDNIKKLNNENLILKNQLAALRETQKNQTLKGNDEYALVDGGVIGVNGAERQAFISLGSKNKVRIGMTFVVYADAAAIRPDADGNYPRGKAMIEITSVGPTSSTCRILSESRGDVIANAVYDPNKIYKMVIYGNFDVNRDGMATSLERNDLSALVDEWGAKVVDDLSGDVDFLVLGEKPVLPPSPSSGAPVEVFEEYIRQTKIVDQYDRLYNQARATSVPILTENRFYTLIGKSPASRR